MDEDMMLDDGPSVPHHGTGAKKPKMGWESNDSSSFRPPSRGGSTSALFRAGSAMLVAATPRPFTARKSSERIVHTATIDDDTDHDETLAIPDMADVEEHQMMKEIALAPLVPSTRVATLQELDHEFTKKPFATIGEIDLLLILKDALFSDEHLIRESDDVWTWDSLFADIASAVDVSESDKSHY